eukprot:2250647-Pleurochrysis_carterae.AAC.1
MASRSAVESPARTPASSSSRPSSESSYVAPRKADALFKLARMHGFDPPMDSQPSLTRARRKEAGSKRRGKGGRRQGRGGKCRAM